MNLKFVTRRGSSRYTGSFFEQYRTDKLNANTFGNVARGLPKDELRRHDFGNFMARSSDLTITTSCSAS